MLRHEAEAGEVSTNTQIERGVGLRLHVMRRGCQRKKGAPKWPVLQGWLGIFGPYPSKTGGLGWLQLTR